MITHNPMVDYCIITIKPMYHHNRTPSFELFNRDPVYRGTPVVCTNIFILNINIDPHNIYCRLNFLSHLCCVREF